MTKWLKKMHLYGTWKKIVFFLINRIFTGIGSFSCSAKRVLMRSLGHSIGHNTTIVGPIQVSGHIEVGNACWINRNFYVHGNGCVIIGNNCDIAPEVSLLTGGHEIGDHERRAGVGESYKIQIGNGVWIGARATITGNTSIGSGCVIAACACVTRDTSPDGLYGGVPAKLIRSLN